MILLFDNYDSFTYNLLDYLEQLGAECLLIRNDQFTLEEISKLQFDAIVISAGPGRPAQSGMLMKLIEHYHDKLAILGICLGQQALGEYFGAELVKAEFPMHGKTSVINTYPHAMFANVPNQIEMMRYHSLILKNLPVCLQLTSETANREIMSFAHTHFPIWAFQFHPESILSTYGITLINNWLTEFKLIV